MQLPTLDRIPSIKFSKCEFITITKPCTNRELPVHFYVRTCCGSFFDFLPVHFYVRTCGGSFFDFLPVHFYVRTCGDSFFDIFPGDPAKRRKAQK
jgi:rubredoxin